MKVHEYMRGRYASESDDPDTFICPLCDDRTGHFKIWVLDYTAYCYCVRCGQPEAGDRDLYALIARLENISKADVRRRFGVLKDNLIQDPYAEGSFEEPPIDMEALVAQLDKPIREVLLKPAEPPAIPKELPVLKTTNTGVRRSWVLNKGHLKAWRGWFPDPLDPPSMMGRKAFEYLKSRGFDASHVKKYRLRYAEDGEGSDEYFSRRYHGRLMIPVFQRGELLFFQGRGFINQEPKYDSPKVLRPEDRKEEDHPWLPAGQSLFGFDFACGQETLILVEGALDAIRIGPGGLALLGKGLTDARLALLAELKKLGAKRLILWMDTDVSQDERLRMVEKTRAVLPTFWTESKIQVKNKRLKDAAEMTLEQCQQTLSQAQEVGFLDRLGL